MKTDAELWAMVVEFDRLAEQEPTREGMARQLAISEHMAAWLGAHPGAAASMDDYHLGQSAGLCVAMAPSRADARQVAGAS